MTFSLKSAADTDFLGHCGMPRCEMVSDTGQNTWAKEKFPQLEYVLKYQVEQEGNNKCIKTIFIKYWFFFERDEQNILRQGTVLLWLLIQ